MKEQKNKQLENSPKKKPKWLRALETQSWQAELIISGLAIFGSLQLPDLLNSIVDYCLFNFSEKYMDVFSLLFVYPYFAAAILIFSFIIHLILRALWIGMLGLVSVYPEGINLDQNLFSKDYMQKFTKKYPDINQFNKELDDLCSTIFASSAFITIVMVMISIIISISLIIATLINMILPSLSIVYIMIVLGGLFLIISLFGSILSMKSLREKKWVKKIHFPFSQLFGNIVYLFALKPMSYITMTFMTQSKNKSSFSMNVFAGLFSLVFAVLFVLPFIQQSNMNYFRQERFFGYGGNSHYLHSSKYENLFPKNPTLITPVIQSDIIEGSTIKLFIPWLHREQFYADETCGEYVENKDLENYEKRNARTKFRVDCCKEYFQIYLNDSLVTGINYYQHSHPNNEEPGFLTYIPTDNCKPMENVLKVKSHYKNDEGEMREIQIPFIFEGK